MHLAHRTRDDELFAIIDREVERQNTTLQLIAIGELHLAGGAARPRARSSPTSTPRATRASGTTAATRSSTRSRTSPATGPSALFGAEHANVQPHAGANANMAVYLALLDPGDTVLGLRLDQGGHLTHGSPVNASGKLYHFVVLRRDRRATSASTSTRCATLALRAPAEDDRRRRHRLPADHRPEPVPRDRRRGRRAVPVRRRPHRRAHRRRGRTRTRSPHADIVTFTTHKTLRGPAGRLHPVARPSTPTAIDKAVFPGLQGGPLEHVIAAKAVAFREAAQPAFTDYAAPDRRQRRGARRRRWPGTGFRLVSGGTDNHLMLVDLRTFDADLTGKKARLALDRAGISLNKNTVPDDPRPPFVTSGLRIGTPAVTTQGMGEAEMAHDRRRSSTGCSRAATTPPSWPPSATRSPTLCSKFTAVRR